VPAAALALRADSAVVASSIVDISPSTRAERSP
jgi:hypothetical protein